MRGPLGFLAALTSDGSNEEGRPAANVGAAFLVAAVVVAVVGLKWLGTGGDDGNAIADSWTLGNSSESAGNTTIPPTPAAIAVRLGTETSSASDDIIGTTPTTRPGSTTTRPGTAAGTGGTGTTGGGSGTTTGGGGITTETTTGPTITESTTSTTEDTTTSSDTTETTETTVTPPSPRAARRGLIGGLLGGLFG